MKQPHPRVGAFALAGVLLVCLASAAAGDLVISEVVDGSRTGGLPKWVELTNSGNAAIPDLSAYSIGNCNNGLTTLGGGASTTLPAVALAAGASFVVSYEGDPSPTFTDTYGFAPGVSLGPFINGDDAIVLFLGPAVDAGYPWTNVVDVFGQVGVDGTGQPWEYLDTWARRKPYQSKGSGSLTFDATRFTYGAVNSLDGVDDADAKAKLLAQTEPGTHFLPGAPVWVLLGMGAMLAMAGALAFTRRKQSQAV